MGEEEKSFRKVLSLASCMRSVDRVRESCLVSVASFLPCGASMWLHVCACVWPSMWVRGHVPKHGLKKR